MFVKRFYDEKLAQASYMVGCPGVGEAIVIDAGRNVEPYLSAASDEGLNIVAVTETHIHADFASGSRELAARTGATLYVSDDGNAEWKYAFANDPGVQLLRDGSTIQIGSVRLEAVHTPGHTPEHLSFVVTDESSSSEPWGAFTGDFIFVGDVGRPDLLERAAGYQGTMQEAARTLFASLQKFKRYPASMMILPGHGAGSACGKSLGGVAWSSLGYEMTANWGLLANSEDRFVEEVLAGQPSPPVYFKEMKRLNKAGAPLIGRVSAPTRYTGARLKDALATATVIDLRDSAVVAKGSPFGAIHIPLNKSFSTWAGWLVPYGKPIYLIASQESQAEEAARDLASIGLDLVDGWFGPESLKAVETYQVPQLSAEELLENPGEATVLDVRNAPEYAAGHVPGAIHIPLGELPNRIGEVPTDRPLVVHCAGGTRSSMAISILKKHGVDDAENLSGGFTAYQKAVKQVEPERALGS